ncbi:uncharacterized protein [Macrobrachium rosenbergii]|uniref:uncharacterized protein n=1 Tax=Macrobrachium rosenbergii TaxID=79674 RepID=UPI0034D705E2
MDVVNRHLVDATDLSTMPINAAPAELALHITDSKDNSAYLLATYPDVFKPGLRQSHQIPAKHSILHHIKTSGPPIHSRFRCLLPEKLAAGKKTFSEIEKMGLCQKASSPWASPLLIVTKQDAPYVNAETHRRQNVITEVDHYPLPNITDVTTFTGQKSSQSWTFSKRVEFLGHLITAEGVQSLSRRSLPSGSSSPHHHQGSTRIPQNGNYYHRFLPDIASTLAPLHEVLKGKSKALTCGSPQEAAFTSIKNTLTKATALSFSAPAITEFNCTLHHIPGKHNPVSDVLSRISIDAVQISLNYKQLRAKQQRNTELNACKASLTSLQCHDVPLNDNSPISILCDINTGCPCPWIPQALRHHIFDIVHSLAHPSG